MFRSTSNTGWLFLRRSLSKTSATTSKPPPAWRSSSRILPCVSCVDASRLPSSSSQTFNHTVIRSLHYYASRSPPVLPSDFSNNLIPLYTTFPTKLAHHRIVGIRFLNSDSSKPPPPPSNESNSSETTSSSTNTTATSTVEDALQRASSNPTVKGLRDSMDITMKEVRSKVNPRDLLYYFALLTVFGLLIVGPIAARHMQRSDTDYDDLDSEDPISDLAAFVRNEVLQESGNGYEETGRKLGGLDSLIADLLRSPHIQNAINELVNKILTSPQFKRSCSILLKELWKDLVEDPDTLKQVIHLLYNAIQDEAIKDAAVQLVTEVFADQEVLDEVVELFQRLGQEPKVQVATQELLVESAHNALNDPEILDHSMEFATDVVGDDIVQQTAGEALYNTLSYAVRPTLSVFLAVLGTGLIFVSLMAFQHSISPESQSQSLDRVLTNFEKSGLVQAVIKLITFPWTALVACKDALVWLFLLPVRLVSGTLAGMGRAGNATIDAINRCIRWLLNLPIQLAQSVLGALGRGFTTISDGTATQLRQLATALSGSFLGIFLHSLADGIVATTRGLQHAWVVSNQTAENGAIAVEVFWNQTLAIVEKGVAKTVAGWVATQSALISTSEAIRHGWVSSNRVLGKAALDLEFFVKVATSKALIHGRQMEKRAAQYGVTRETIRDVSKQTMDSIVSGYHWLDRGAGKLGLVLQDLLQRLSAQAKELRRRYRPAI